MVLPCAFLIDELDGGRREQVSTVRKHASAAGISPRTLDRAKAKLGVKSEKESFAGVWTWSLPSQVRQRPDSNPHESTKDANSAYIEPLAPLEGR